MEKTASRTPLLHSFSADFHESELLEDASNRRSSRKRALGDWPNGRWRRTRSLGQSEKWSGWWTLAAEGRCSRTKKSLCATVERILDIWGTLCYGA